MWRRQAEAFDLPICPLGLGRSSEYQRTAILFWPAFARSSIDASYMDQPESPGLTAGVFTMCRYAAPKPNRPERTRRHPQRVCVGELAGSRQKR